MRWHALWFFASLLIAFGINAQMKPEIAFPPDSDDTSVSSGELELALDGAPQSFDLIAIRVLAMNVPRTFGAPIKVRELLIRGPLEDGESTSDIDIYVDFADPGISPNARDVELIRGRELGVLPHPPGRDAQSQIRLPGNSEPSEVVSGTLVITDAVELPVDDGSATWRVGGRIDVQLRDGDQLQAYTGTLKARLRWD